MAERRMFNKTLMSGNLFSSLSKNAKLLYFNLNLQADDDGVCGNSWAICRLSGSTRKHLQELIDCGWLLQFPQGEVVIVHWHIHNQIRKDRYKPSLFTQVTRCIHKNADGLYERLPDGCQNDDQSETQQSIDQQSKEKKKISQYNIGQARKAEQTTAAPVDPPPVPAEPADDYDIDFDGILERYHTYCQDLKPCEQITPKLRAKIINCFRAGYDMTKLTDAFLAAGSSAFLCGENDRNWQADLTWIMSPYRLKCIMAGKYHDWTTDSQPILPDGNHTCDLYADFV